MFSDDMPGVMKWPHLFQPRQIGGLTARNSVKYAACSVSNFNTRDGRITERELARMAVVAATGAGIITNQGAYPDPAGLGKAYFRQLSLADDDAIEGFARVAELIHEASAIAIQQILHGGRYGGIDADHCVQPSDVPQTLRHFRPPRAMDQDEVRQCIQDHVAAAQRAMKAGYDGVEITAFMGYLLSNFLSPFTNRRTDEYGGSLENRCRFMTELIDSTKQAIGDGVFWIRLNGEELMDERGGSTPEECIEYMKVAEQAGADGISIVVGWHESTRGALGRELATDEWLYLAERAKAAVSIPVAFGPRFGDPVLADQALADGKMDFWEVCRPFLADPRLLQKVATDRIDQITPCMGGLTCLARMFRNLPYICTVNPRLGHEYEPAYHVEKTGSPKKVLVIGGGPAGMECARVAARRGHEVALLERASDLGGQLRAATLEIQGGGDAFRKLIESYRRQIEVAGVAVRLGCEVTPAIVEEFGPDVAVVATGAQLQVPSIPGMSLPTVFQSWWEDPADLPEGERVVVLGVDRGALVLAEHLAELGRKVTVVGSGKVAGDVIPTFKWRHMSWLKELGIQKQSGAQVERITPEGVHIVTREGEDQVLQADVVVLGGPRASVNELTIALEFSVDELHTIGDAIMPRNMASAIHEGFRLGNRL